MLKSLRASIELIGFLLGAAALSGGQATPAITQTAKGSPCANIVALSGAKVDCAHLTPAQKKAIEEIPSILRMTLENQDYLDAIMKKLDEMSRTPAAQIQVTTGNISQGPCSVTQIAGAGNQANVECPPPLAITASTQRQLPTGDPNAPYETIFTISTNIPAQIGDFRFTCTESPLRVTVDRISDYEIVDGPQSLDPNDPNTLIYPIKPELLNPNRLITVRVFSEAPLRVLSGNASGYPITFAPQ